MIATVARHDIGRLARAAQSWVVAALFAALAGYLFLTQLERWIAAQDALRLQDHPPGLTGFLGVNVLGPLAIAIGVLAPLYAMRSFADEFRERTWALWQSSPVPLWSLAIGKLIAVVAAMSVLVMIAVGMIASLAAFARLDMAVLASGALGLLLCAAATASIGLFCSSLVRQPLAGAAGAIAAVMLLWLVGSAAGTSAWLAALAQLSPGQHLASFFQGYPASGDALYFVLCTALFTALTVIRLDALRHGSHDGGGA